MEQTSLWWGLGQLCLWWRSEELHLQRLQQGIGYVAGFLTLGRPGKQRRRLEAGQFATFQGAFPSDLLPPPPKGSFKEFHELETKLS